MSDANKHFYSIGGYAFIAPIVIFLALSRDAALERAHSAFPGSEAGPGIILFLVLFLIYLGRALVLLSPTLFLTSRWQRLLKYGLVAAILPELVVMYVTLSLLTQGACTESGWISSCGWGMIVFFPIGVSCVFQLIGMAIGALRVRFASSS